MYVARRRSGPVEVAFTDASIDLQGARPGFEQALARVSADTGVTFARMNQVHGAEVVTVREAFAADAPVPTADALVTDVAGLGLMVRVADCVPVVLADVDRGVLGVVHAGRHGVALDVATRAVARMRDLGAERLAAWIGPHVCGRCYEVPEQMREEVATVVPQTRAETRGWTPSLDLGAGVRAQLDAAQVETEVVAGCTLEGDRLHSYRRDGAAAGRLAGLVWCR